jgi:hypothetical protein
VRLLLDEGPFHAKVQSREEKPQSKTGLGLLTLLQSDVSIGHAEKRGELRRLAATKNNRLNSSATFNRCSKQFDESPALFASAGLLHAERSLSFGLWSL